MKIVNVGSLFTASLVALGSVACEKPPSTAATAAPGPSAAAGPFRPHPPFAIVDPGPTNRTEELRQAIAHRDQMMPMRRPEQSGPISYALTPFWQNVGPNNFHSSGNPNGANDTNGGRVNAVAFDPQHNGTWYMGSPNGGVWKTTDFGNHWAPITDSWSCLQVSTVVVDPNNGNTVYAGGGDFMGGSMCSMGVMKSSDGGATWANSGLAGITIPRLVVDPDDSNNLIAVTSWGNVYRSTDAGASWNVVVNVGTDWSDVEYSPPDFLYPRYFYAVGNGQGGGLFYRSQDHGATWTQKTLPLTKLDGKGNPVTQLGLSVAASLINPSVVYLLANSDRKVLVSYDAGDDWTDITGNLANDGWFWAQAGYNYAIAASTVGDGRLGGSGQDAIYVATTDAYRSIGGNGVWTSVDTGGADNHGLAVNPFDRNSLLAGSDAGVANLTYLPDWGITTRVELNATINVMELYQSAYSRSRADYILSAAQDNGNPFSNGNLANWINVGGGDGGSAAVNPLNDNWQYLSINFYNDQRQLWRTDSGWTTKQGITPATNKEPAAERVPVVIDPGRPWFMYLATNFLYRFDENAYLALHDKSQYQSAWTNHLGNQMLSSTAAVNAVAVAQSDSNRIYTASGDGEIWMTRDGGTTWQRIDGGQFVNGFKQGFTSLSVDPQNADDVLVGIWRNNGLSHLWRTTNPGSTTWTDVTRQNQTDGLPQVAVNTIERDPAASTTNWYVGTDIGVFYTDDAGAHWYNATGPLGMPNLPVSDLKATPEGYMNATTYGRGIWRAKLGCQPKTCASTGSNCGTIDDGCGEIRGCGSCTWPATCGGNGTPNVCGVCQPATCQVGMCGSLNDGCGGTIQCGGCSAGEVCYYNECTPRRCVPRHCPKGSYWNPDDCACERGLPM